MQQKHGGLGSGRTEPQNQSFGGSPPSVSGSPVMKRARTRQVGLEVLSGWVWPFFDVRFSSLRVLDVTSFAFTCSRECVTINLHKREVAQGF